MPIGISSPARNLFLLGSTGAQVVTNFFKAVDLSASSDGGFFPSNIKYRYSDDSYILSGYASDAQSKGFGWIENRTYNTETAASTQVWDSRIESTSLENVLLRKIIVDNNGDIIAVGETSGTSWIIKYSPSGAVNWQATSFTGNLSYRDVAHDGSSYYACGKTSGTNSVAYVEKYDSNGNPGWGKAATFSNDGVSFNSIAIADDGNVVAVGRVNDINGVKGLIVKFDSQTGDIIWDKTITSPLKYSNLSSLQESIYLKKIFTDSNGQLYVVGKITSFRTGVLSQQGCLIKFDTEGNIIWQRQTPIDATKLVEFYDVNAEDETEQVIVLGRYYDGTANNQMGILSKYTKDGSLLWRRTIRSSRESSDTFSSIANPPALDADSSFYYIIFNDETPNGAAGEPDRYTFGKVSTSGNGLGGFEYLDSTGESILYDIVSIDNEVAILQDGSVTNSVSDLRSIPYSATKIVFDDFATNIAGKKRQMDSADSFEYSGSPAIRPVDFQEMNLLPTDPTDGVEGRLKGGTFEQPTTSDLDIIFSTPLSPGTVTFDQGSNPDNTSMKNFMQNQLALATAGDTFDFLWYNDDGDADYAELIIDNVTVTNPNTMSGVSFTYTASSSTGIPVSSPPPYSPTTITGSNVGGNYILTRYNRGPELITNGDFENSNFTGWTPTGSDTRTSFASPHGSVSLILLAYGTTGGLYQSFTTEVGKTYKVSVDSEGGPYVRIFDGSGVSGTTLLTMNTNLSGSGYEAGQTETFTATSTTSTFAIVGILPGQAVLVDNISVRQTPLRVVVGDQSGNGHDVVVNGATLNAAGYWEFDRTDDYISVDTLPDDFDTITVEMWTTLNQSFDLPNYRVGVLKCSDANWADGFGFFELSNSNTNARTLYWFVNAWNGSHRIAVDVSSSEYTQFTHWVGTYDGSNLKLYKNGVLLDTSAYTDAIVNSNKPLFIGGGESNPYQAVAAGNYFWWWDGDIGDVRIYPRALTAAQAFQNYNATKSKYINEAPDTAPKISDRAIVYDSNLLLNYDFGNRASYDRVENLIEISEDFTGTGWAETFTSIVPNVAIAPDGTMTADKIVEDTNNTFHFLANTEGIGAEPVVWSCFIKAAERTQASLFLTQGGNNGAIFNLDTGTIASVSGAGNTAQIQDVGNGWYRCIVKNDGAADMNDGVRVGPVNGSLTNYQGDGTSGIYVWGAQYERATEVSRYIRTYGTAITAPTTVKNLSSTSYPSTISGAEFNSAGYFVFDNANNDEIITSQTTVADTGIPGLTVEVWANLSSSTVFGTGGQSWLFGEEGRYRLTYTSTSISWTCATANNGWFTTGTSITPSGLTILDGWHHIVGVYDGTNIRLDLDGTTQLTSTSAISGNVNSAGDPVMSLMGTDASNVGWGTGNIGEVRIYDTALSATEVSQNFNATKSKYGL